MTAKTRRVNQNWWITTLMIKEHRYRPPVAKDIKCEVLVNLQNYKQDNAHGRGPQ